jgi:hypothetical protein
LHGTEPYKATDDILKPMNGVSVGIVVREDKDSITLAIDRWQTNEYRNCETINKRQINKIQYTKLRLKGKL